jgi:hypothetical protein
MSMLTTLKKELPSFSLLPEMTGTYQEERWQGEWPSLELVFYKVYGLGASGNLKVTEGWVPVAHA